MRSDRVDSAELEGVLVIDVFESNNIAIVERWHGLVDQHLLAAKDATGCDAEMTWWTKVDTGWRKSVD